MTHLVNIYASMFLAHYSLFKNAWAHLVLSCVWFVVGIAAMWRELNKQDFDVLVDEQV